MRSDTSWREKRIDVRQVFVEGQARERGRPTLFAAPGNMFLMFHLGRPDVLPTGDLGIRRAVMNRYSLDELPLPAALSEIAEPWRPYRTLACRYLWRSLDATPV
jgi:hypothetical protein